VAYIVLARLISPANFGLFAAASVVTGVGGLFAESGMMSALINRRDRLEEAASTAFFSLLLSGCLLSLGALAIAPLLGLLFRNGRVGDLAAALSGCLLIHSLSIVPDSLLQRRMSFARRVGVDPIGSIAFAVVAITACSNGAGAWGLVAGTYAAMGVQGVLAWVFARTVPRWRFASIAMWRELAAYARPIVVSEILRVIAGQLDVIMLGRFKGAATLGQYRNGLRLAQQPVNAFVDVGAYVLQPTFMRLRDHRERLSSAVRHVFGAVAASALPVSVAMIPLGVPVAVLALGSRWRPAGHAIAGLSFSLLGGAIISVTAETLKATGRPALLIRITSVNLAVTSAAVVAAAIPFGLLGVAVAVSVSQCVTAVYAFQLLTGQIDIGWRELSREFAGPGVAAAVMLVALLAYASTVHPLSHTEAGAIALTLAQVGIGVVAYAAILTTVDRRRRGDARRLLARIASLRRAPPGASSRGADPGPR
jgi:PST family polysaccharide transporter